ncbi:hypothetical protein Ddye_016662 [Dipteronia dyeriana]|uniref:Uncharacterized protein n=1 Tax=Dipteronia dyeriana TaxID=168575 RepID=A0AAD9X094_9ROSI|nr:hypothetical protein Ddye_016662 [Dipteronia dyeriana]
MEEGCVQKSVRWLQGLNLGTIGHELEALTHVGLQIVETREGFIRFNFIVLSHLAVILAYFSQVSSTLLLSLFSLFVRLCSHKFICTIMYDEDGNWHVGAMATLINSVGGAATHSFGGHVKTSVDFDISFYSTAKIQDENGYWNVGAMATLIDDVGAAAIHTLGANIKLSVDFNISFYSTAKIQVIFFLSYP